MKTPEVVNYIEISGEDVEIDSLTNEEIVKAGILIQDNLMSAAGYQRIDAQPFVYHCANPAILPLR